MKQKKLMSTVVLSLSLALISCGDKEAESNKLSENASIVDQVVDTVFAEDNIMEYIPAQTPILMAYAKDSRYPLPENFKQKMEKMYGSLGEIIKMAMEENLKKYADKADQSGTQAANEFVDKWLTKDGLKKMGLSITENEFALYAVDLFPVMRMTLADSHSMEEVLDEFMAQANNSKADAVLKTNVADHTVYIVGDKEMKVMVSLKGNAIAASFAPSRDADRLMPQLLGFEKPAKNVVQSDQFQDTISKYNYMSNSLYWVNFRELADVFINPQQYNTPLLDMLQIQDNLLSVECKTEILQIMDKFPRIVGGYTLLDEHAMNSHMALEMANGLGSKLATMSGRIPTSSTDAAVSYGFSFDIAAAKKLALGFATAIETEPYKCQYMSDLNMQATTIKAQLEQPLPPFVGNFKGINVIVNELDLDLAKQDPNQMIKNLKAKVLLAVDNPEALKGMAEMMMPEIQKLGLKVGQQAVNISDLIPVKGSQIPVNLDHVFMAMGSETLGASLGEGTDIELTEDVSSISNNHLFKLKISAELYKDIFSGLGDLSAGLGEEMQQQLNIQKMFMTDMLWWQSETASMDFTDRGFEINMDIIY